jgi:hypothetical protein
VASESDKADVPKGLPELVLANPKLSYSSTLCLFPSISSLLSALVRSLTTHQFGYNVECGQTKTDLTVRAVGQYKRETLVTMITISSLTSSLPVPERRPKVRAKFPVFHIEFTRIKGNMLYFQSWIREVSLAMQAAAQVAAKA